MNLPRVGTRLSLEDLVGAMFAARVVSEMATGVAIEWHGDETPVEGECTVSWVSERGLLLMTCDLHVVDRFGRLEAAVGPKLVQRREAVRVELTLPVHLLSPDRTPGKLLYTRNVSETGLLLAGEVPLDVNEPCRLQLELPDRPEEPVEVLGRIIRSQKEGLLAIELLDLPRAQQDRLLHIVFEQQRRELRQRRNQEPLLRVVGRGI